jgi:hypothetical protein
MKIADKIKKDIQYITALGEMKKFYILYIFIIYFCFKT